MKAQHRAHDSVAAVTRMLKQEEHHLKIFEKLIVERRVRPTALERVW